MKKLPVKILVSFLLSVLTFGQSNQLTPEQIIKSGKVTMFSDVVEKIPIIYQKNNLPFIKVIIKNQEYLFLFDTGASVCVLSTEIIKAQESDKKVKIYDMSGNQTKVGVAIQDIQIGNIFFNDIACIITDTKRLANQGCVKIDGIIGSNLLKFCNWEINPQNQTLSFTQSNIEKQPQSLEFDFELSNSYLPFITFNYKEIELNTLVDTGYSDFLDVNNVQMKKSKYFYKLPFFEGQGQQALTINSTQEGKLFATRIDTLKSNKFYIADIPTNLIEGKPKLGASFLKQYIFSYNFLSKKIFLTPALLEKNLVQTYSVTFGLNEANELIINFVWNNVETENLGLAVGQRVVKIDGQDTTTFTAADLCELKQTIDQKIEINCSVVIDKKNKEIILSKRNKYPDN